MEYRFEIVSGNTLDVESFIGETLDLGVFWYDVNLPLRAPFPYSSKLDTDWEIEGLQNAATRFGVVVAYRGVKAQHPLAYDDVNFDELSKGQPVTKTQVIRSRVKALFNINKKGGKS